MDIKELYKLQMVGQMGVGAQRQGGLTFAAYIYQFIFMIMMSLLDDIVKALPNVASVIKQNFTSFFTKKVKEKIGQLEERQPLLGDNSLSLNTRHTLNSFVLTRTYVDVDSATSSQNTNNNDSESNAIVDAVIAKISKLHNVPSFSLINNGQVMVVYKDKPIQLTKDIFVKINNVAMTDSGILSNVKMTLLSNSLSAAEIACYVKNLYEKHLQELKNSLGSNIYFFDQKSKEGQAPPLPAGTDKASIASHKRMLINTAPKSLTFSMTPFYSNKSFRNICGDEIRHIENRVRFFIDNKDWYDSKGIPYQLGLLLSGIPGAGKTSAIRAIANLTKRHIINVNFANITTATQLKTLFCSDKISVYDSTMTNTHSYYIPIEQRLYVLEEIDAIGDIVKQRTYDTSKADSCSTKDVINDELTLMEILTVLDGTIEFPGRMIIVTTNHPEILDEALIRPGRIDVQVKFGYANASLIAEMFQAYLDYPLPSKEYSRLPCGSLSPAEVGQVFFRHFGAAEEDISKVIDDLIETAKIKNANLCLQHPVVVAENKESCSDTSTTDVCIGSAADLKYTVAGGQHVVSVSIRPPPSQFEMDNVLGSEIESFTFNTFSTQANVW